LKSGGGTGLFQPICRNIQNEFYCFRPRPGVEIGAAVAALRGLITEVVVEFLLIRL